MTLRRLLYYRIKILLSGISSGKPGLRTWKLLVVTIVAIGVFWVVFYVFHALFRILGEAGEIGEQLSQLVLITIIHAIFLVAFTLDVATTMNMFFLSSDLTLLIPTPLSTTKIFLLKYIDALASSSLLSVVIGLPAAFAFGNVTCAPLIYYFCLLPTILLLLSIPVSIGTLIGIAISRFASPRRTKEVLALVSSLIGLGLWLGVQLLRQRVASGNVADISNYSELLSRSLANPVIGKLPSTFAAKALISFSGPHLLDGALNLLFLLGLASSILMGSIQVAKKAYLTGWIRALSAAPSTPKKRESNLLDPFIFLPAFERAVARTTLKTYLRDPQQVSQFATFAIMLFLIAILPGTSFVRGASTEIRLITAISYIGFICSFNLAMALMIIDGKSFWMIIASPVSPVRKVISKIVANLFFFIPILLALLVSLRISNQIASRTLALITPSVMAISIAGASLGSAIGLHYANWDWDNPKRMLKPGGRLIMLAVIFVFMALPNILLGLVGKEITASLALYINLIVTMPLAAILTVVSVVVCARKLSRMEWRV